jgi:hypothetical protein
MSYIPPDFTQRLTREFDGRLRMRWSDQRRAFQVEVKCGRRTHDIPLFNPQSDDCVRARDGYMRVMEIQPRATFECPTRVSKEPNAPRCGVKLEIPLRQRVEVTCLNCRQHGRDGRTRAEYWPLDDRLLDRLKQIDPKRQWAAQQVNEMDLSNKRAELMRELDALNDIDALNYDYYNAIAGIPQFGYANTTAWQNAPASPGHIRLR